MGGPSSEVFGALGLFLRKHNAIVISWEFRVFTFVRMREGLLEVHEYNSIYDIKQTMDIASYLAILKCDDTD